MTGRTSGPQIDLTGRGNDNLTLSFPVEKADSAKRASGAARRMPKASTMIKKANIDRASAELINGAAPLPGSGIAGHDEPKDNLRALYDLPRGGPARLRVENRIGRALQRTCGDMSIRGEFCVDTKPPGENIHIVSSGECGPSGACFPPRIAQCLPSQRRSRNEELV